MPHALWGPQRFWTGSERIGQWPFVFVFNLSKTMATVMANDAAIPPVAQFRGLLRILIANKRLGLQLKSINR